MKDIQSDKAVNYIINQIKKLEKNGTVMVQ